MFSSSITQPLSALGDLLVIKNFPWNILFDKESGSIKAIEPATGYDCKLMQEATRGTNKCFHWLHSRFSSICSYVGQTIQTFFFWNITPFQKKVFKNVWHGTLWLLNSDFFFLGSDTRKSSCSKSHNFKISTFSHTAAFLGRAQTRTGRMSSCQPVENKL